MATKILVLGGGFAGLRAAMELSRRGGRRVSVQLVDRRSDSEFSPLYPDLISGRMSGRVLRYSLAAACRSMGVEFIRADVRHVDPAAMRVDTDGGVLGGDFIICCLGCETNYFGNGELAARAPGLKSVREGLLIRNAARRLLAERRAGERPSLIAVGGGYTGFEAASHLARLASRATGLPFARLGEAVEIIIAERGDEVLRNVSPRVRAWALELMAGFGVEVRMGLTVDAVESGVAAPAAIGEPAVEGSWAPCAVELSDGSRRERALVVWAAGVTPGPVAGSMDAQKVLGGRLGVDEFLRVGGRERFFAAGDVAGARPIGQSSPLRMGVQFSLMGGRCAAGNVLRSIRGRGLEEFDPWDPGYIVPLAPGAGAGTVMGHELRGRLPQAMHYMICSARSWGWANRFGVLRCAIGRR